MVGIGKPLTVLDHWLAGSGKGDQRVVKSHDLFNQTLTNILEFPVFICYATDQLFKGKGKGILFLADLACLHQTFIQIIQPSTAFQQTVTVLVQRLFFGVDGV